MQELERSRRFAWMWGSVLLATLTIAMIAFLRSGRSRAALDVPELEPPPPEDAADVIVLVEPRAAPIAPDFAADTSKRVEARTITETVRTAAAGDAGIIRGRLLDQESGEPLVIWNTIDFRLVFSTPDGAVLEEVALGPEAMFETRHAFPRGIVQVDLNLGGDGQSLGIHRQLFEPAGEEWTIRVGVGVIVPLILVAPGGVACHATRARIVEQGPTSRDWGDWGWAAIGNSPHPCLHYRSREFERDPELERWVEVQARTEEGDVDLDGRAPLASSDARSLGGVVAPVRVLLTESTVAVGHVVDPHGRPVAGAALWLASRGAAQPENRAPSMAASDNTGLFRLEGLRPGTHALRLRSGLCSRVVRGIEIRTGRNDLGAIELPIAEGSSAIRGRVVDRAGGLRTYALLTLREVGGDGKEWRSLTDFRFSDSTEEGLLFAFENVPPGRYELRPRGHGMSFDPPSVIVTPPVEGVVFEAVEVSAAELDAPAAGETDALLLWRMAVQSAKTPSNQGWTLPILCRDADDELAWFNGRLVPYRAPPLAGVRVLADGKHVATSDAAGMALVTLEHEPARLDFELAGAEVVASFLDGGIRLVVLARE